MSSKPPYPKIWKNEVASIGLEREPGAGRYVKKNARLALKNLSKTTEIMAKIQALRAAVDAAESMLQISFNG